MFDSDEVLFLGFILIIAVAGLGVIGYGAYKESECKQSAIATLHGADLVSALSACEF